MKKLLTIFTLFLTLAVPLHAQVFMMADEENEFRNVFGNGEWNNVIVHGNEFDQTNFTPIGSGILVMTALGGLYLFGKRKSEKMTA